MGSGIAGGVQTPKQPGVIVKDGENFPIIPEHLLRLSPEELQERIDKLGKAAEFNCGSILPDLKLEERIENSQAVHIFAKIAVERQRKAVERL